VSLSWVTPNVGGCAYPVDDATLDALANAGVDVLVNLHERALPARVRSVHIPCPDFSVPDCALAVDAIVREVADGRRVAVNCGAGMGRTGTVLAAYLVHEGRTSDDAIAEVRRLRPGSIETVEQEAAVAAYALELARRKE
jgi:atypical dual specificity phosphatase